MTTPIPAPELFNIQVTAVEVDGGVRFDYVPSDLVIAKMDCIINFQLVNSPGWKFTGLYHTPENTKQFSGPSFSKSRQMITLSDANTAGGTYHFFLYFIDKNGKQHFSDPEVINQPQA